ELSFAENANGGFYSGYDLLPVAAQDVISAAEYQIKQYAVPVVMSGLEMLQNSGKGARRVDDAVAIVRSLRDQCAEAGVPFLFKQWGEWIDDDNIDSAALPAPHIADPNEFFMGHALQPSGMSWRA
ncbi:DUF5131 family protein, partial [Chryseobacterium cucumeris]|uniref:DUF5131 family protein n=1 Tax=Chryseobacterium cucumeris TaxID=1813611 RepID=UPI0023F17044